MAYQTFRVEITRDETRDDGPVGIEITAYIDRMPETNQATVGRLGRAWRGVWNSRLQYTGDFDTLAEALPAIRAAVRWPYGLRISQSKGVFTILVYKWRLALRGVNGYFLDCCALSAAPATICVVTRTGSRVTAKRRPSCRSPAENRRTGGCCRG